MSNCFTDLYDYDLIKKCCRCKNILLKSNFYKSKNMSDGLHPQSKFFDKIQYNENRKKARKYCFENRDKIKEYQLRNRDQINNRMNEYIKNRMKKDVNFRIIRNTRRRVHQALNSKSKSISTKEILGIDIESYRKWIEWQFTPEMNWQNNEIDHVKPICMLDVSKMKK